MEANNSILPMPAPCFDTNALVINASSQAQARTILKIQGYELGILAYRLNLRAVLIRYPGNRQPVKIFTKNIVRDFDFMMNNLLVTEPGYVTSTLEVSPVLYRAAGYFLEYPDAKGAVVRLSDEKQVILSKANSTLIASGTLLQAVERKRIEYWHPQDLDEFRTFTLSLEPNNPDSRREFNFRIFDPITGSNWRRNTNEYRLLEDAFGVKYHFSLNLGQESIPAPR